MNKLISTSGDLFKHQRKHFDLSQIEMATVLNATYVTIQNWEKTVPKPNPKQIVIMLSLGVNPLYPYGYGKLYLPEFEFDQVCDNLRNILNAPEDDEVQE